MVKRGSAVADKERLFMTNVLPNDVIKAIDNLKFGIKSRDNYSIVTALDDEVELKSSSDLMLLSKYFSDPNSESIRHPNFLIKILAERDVEVARRTAPNINEDIIQLIESNQKFKSFWGTTVDGKCIHIELQE